LALFFLEEGSFCLSSNPHGREGDSMYVTYSDLIQIGLLVLAIIALIQDNKKQK
jgi:hypothetical protein